MRSWELKGQSSYQRFPLFSPMSILYLCLYHDIRKKNEILVCYNQKELLYVSQLVGKVRYLPFELKEKISKIHSGD